MVTSVADYNTEPAGKFSTILQAVKNSGVRLIVNTVRGSASTYLYMEALE